jgi:tyrosyl-tRNA synthetase
VTATRHGKDAAAKAQLDAGNLVGGAGDASADVPEASLLAVNFPAKAFYLMSAVGICASSSEARRQIKGGAARLDGEKITDPNQEFASAAELDGRVLQLGKKTFRRLTV